MSTLTQSTHTEHAEAFTLARANSVLHALKAEISRQELKVKESQLKTSGYGYCKPLEWAWRRGYEDFVPENGRIDDEASAKNRRVELYLKFGSDFEVPKRPEYVRDYATTSAPYVETSDSEESSQIFDLYNSLVVRNYFGSNFGGNSTTE